MTFYGRKKEIEILRHERAPNGCTATAHWREFVRLTPTFARWLGKSEEAARFEALATC